MNEHDEIDRSGNTVVNDERPTDGDLDLDSSGITLTPDEGGDLDSASELDVNEIRAGTRGSADADDDEQPPAAPAATVEPEAREATPPAKKDRGSRRVERLQADIDRLTAIRTKTRDEITELERKKRELAGPGTASTAERRADKIAQSETSKVDEKLPPKPRWKDFEAEGKDFDEFSDALDTWNEQRFETIRTQISAEAETRAREQVKAERRAASQSAAVDRMYTRMDEGRKKYADWDAAAAALDEFDMEKDLSKPDFVRDLILHHEQSHEIAYHLGKNPEQMEALHVELADLLTNSMMHVLMESSTPVALLSHLARNRAETEAIAMLPPHQALVRLTRLDTRLAGANDGSPATPKPVSKAPPPPSHRAGTRSAATPRSITDLDPDDYIREREKQERQRRSA